MARLDWKLESSTSVKCQVGIRVPNITRTLSLIPLPSPRQNQMATGEAKLVLPFNPTFSSSSYWMRWQTPVCFLITVSPGIAAAFMLCRLKRRRGCDHLPDATTWAPCFRGVPPLVLPVYRGMVVLAMISVLYSLLRRNGLVEFYFYTQ